MRNLLFAVGILFVFAGFALVTYGSVSQGSVSTGGFILIGPFPIVFGSGSNGPQLAFLSVLLGIVMVAFVTLWAWRFYARSRPDRRNV